MNILIWIIQGILAALFLMAGLMKVIQSKLFLQEKIGGWVDDFSESTLKIIGFLEILGAIALVLPMLLNKLLILTPLGAIGLSLTMIGASLTHIKRKEHKDVIKNIIILALLVIVLIGRSSLLF